MDFLGLLQNASIVGLVSLIVTVLPLAAGAAYAIRPTEQRLALVRPVSLAGIFAALTGALSGAMNILKGISATADPLPSRIVAIASAESMVPLFVGFACLTVAWLLVAVGLRRHPSN